MSPVSLMSYEIADMVRTDIRQGMKQRDLCKKYRLGTATINGVAKGEIWARPGQEPVKPPKGLDLLNAEQKKALRHELRLNGDSRRTNRHLANKYGLTADVVQRFRRKIHGYSLVTRNAALNAQASAPQHCGRDTYFLVDRGGYVTEYCKACPYTRRYG